MAEFLQDIATFLIYKHSAEGWSEILFWSRMCVRKFPGVIQCMALWECCHLELNPTCEITQ